MNEVMQRINLAAWPIWVKLLVGFMLVGLIPVILLMIFTLTSIEEVGTQNIESFLTETATQETQAIAAALARSEAQMRAFVDNSANYERMVTLLPTEEDASINPLARAELISRLQAQLLNTPSSNLLGVELLDADGNLMLQAQAGGAISVVVGEDRQSSAAYLQGVQAGLSGLSSVLAVDADENNQLTLDLVYVLRATEPDSANVITVGFLTGRLNAAQIILDKLNFEGQFLNSRTQLVTRRGFVLDEAGARFGNDPTMDMESVQTVLDGGSQVQYLEINGEAVVRYYVPVPDSPFVLVKQGTASAVSGEVVSSLIARVFALIVGIGALMAVLVLLGNQLFASPLQLVSQAIQAMSRGNYNAPLPDVRRGDEIGELSGNFADMRRQVLDMVTDMENRIEERARDVAATRDISRTAATQRDVQQLMTQVVELVVERFDNIYHAQIFLLDSEQRYAVLRASTGEPGRRLLERGHRLQVGEVSVIGRVTGFGETVIARNTSTSDFHRQNEFLRETQAELAIPLRVGDRVFGALDVQSRQSDSFTPEQTEILETMADQIAVAIESARLYTESLRQLDELERTRRQTTLETWHQYMRNERQRRLESVVGAPPPAGYWDELRQQALERGEVITGEATPRETIPIAVPIRLRGQLLGVVEWEVPQSEFDDNKLLLAQDLTDQLAVNLDNARLFQETQRATVRERLVNEISTSLTAQNDLDQILQLAVREVGKVLHSPQVSIRLKSTANGHKNGDGK